MNNTLTKKEREHVGRVKELACSVCDAPGPSEAHHIKQHFQGLCIPLCADCHRGGHNGIHGQMRIWKVLKKDELTCLNDTVMRLLYGMVR